MGLLSHRKRESFIKTKTNKQIKLPGHVGSHTLKKVQDRN